MNVPTANVVVGFNRETMKKLFSTGANLAGLVKELSNDNTDAILFNNVSNPNFISFEHSLGFGQSNTMTLSFIDPENAFEERFFSANFVDLFGSYITPESQNSVSFSTNSNDDALKSLDNYSDEDLYDFKNELLGVAGNRKIYVAYGTGNNLELWSGPHTMTLANASIKAEGSKKITLKLVGTVNELDTDLRRGAFQEPVNLNLQGLKVRFSGESQEIKFVDRQDDDPSKPITKPRDKYYDPTEYFSEDVQLQAYEGFRDKRFSVLGNTAELIEKIDIHSIVVDTIRSYVQKATNNVNVIVLLPDINLLCKQAISDKAKQINLVDPSGVLVTGLGAAAATTALAGTNSGSKVRSTVADTYLKSQTIRGKELLLISSILKSLGLKLHEGDRLDAGFGVFENSEPKSSPFGPIAIRRDNEKVPTSEAAFDDYFKTSYFTAVISKTERFIPNHYKVIETIYDNIRKLSKESYQMGTLACLTETQNEILDLWSLSSGRSWAKRYTFAGYDTFQPDTPPVIVGDLNLIKDYLYGGIDLVEAKEKENFFKKKAAKARVDKKYEDATHYTIAAALVHPLHPLDRATLDNHTYNREIRELTYPSAKNSIGVFGDVSDTELGEFAYEDEAFSDKEKKYIKQQGIPVFRYNVQNPNVLDLKFNFSPQYFANLKFGFEKEIERRASAVVEGVLPTNIGNLPIRTPGAAFAYMISKKYGMGDGGPTNSEIVKSLANRISPELAASLGTDSTKDAADFFAAATKRLLQTNLNGVIQIQQALPGNPQSILADFTEKVYRDCMQVQITTLPSFQVSQTHEIGQPALLFAQDQPILQESQPRRSLINKFFSGIYKVMAFKHRIDSSNVTSEFRLLKNSANYYVDDRTTA